MTGGTSPGTFPLPDAVGTTTIPKDFRRGYIHSFNLTVEREFAGFVANAGYVGSRGIRPLVNMNINPAPEGTGQKWPNPERAISPHHCGYLSDGD